MKEFEKFDRIVRGYKKRANYPYIGQFARAR